MASIHKFTSVLFKIPKKFTGSLIQNSINYLRNVFLDYKSVYLETVKDIKDRPFKASVIFGIISGGFYCIYDNPDEEEYQVNLIDANNRISRVADAIRNKKSCFYVHEIFQLHNQHLLRYQSFEFPPELQLYQTQCRYLRPRWRIDFNNFIDIGFLGQYWLIENKMKEYDINEDEW
ncbi:hypothetical protein QR98_0097660 [Sarcoptes scabiei]|uniref:Uncharacterized protein n=1 Tax=Sarcoptes scabiei TaxID=52283 RepID=A0A132AJN6_SARSC|nr:hypothetical protein QR98_0097660 [Sarcoptes scabiei]